MANLSLILNRERAVATKQLTDADLGLSDFSHQTHIGLSAQVFTYMGINEYYSNSILVYNNTIYYLDCYVDKIVREDSIGASKIRKGEYTYSIVDKIWELVRTDTNSVWYLVWFGLNDGSPVFWLIKAGSADWSKMGLYLKSRMMVYKSYSTKFPLLIDKINSKLNTFESWRDRK